MRKGVLAVVFVLLALAVAGCKGGDKVVSSSATPFIGGMDGLTMKFADNSPPAEVTDAQKDTAGTVKPTFPFDIVLLLENIGENDVPRGKVNVSVSGISASDFLKDSGTKNVEGKPVSLRGVNPQDDLSGVKKDPEGNKIPGTTVDVRFEGLAYQKELQGNNEFPVQADVCYTYQTRAVTDVCIRADATKAASGVCQISGSKPIFSSGAPVHVTSVKESVGGRNKVLLTFNVRSVGAGNVYKIEATDKAATCPRGEFSKQDQVLVEVKTGITNTPGLTCSGVSKVDAGTDSANGVYVGYLRLSNSEGTFSCIQSTPNEDALKKVDIKLTYNYLTSKSTKILVKHLLS